MHTVGLMTALLRLRFHAVDSNYDNTTNTHIDKDNTNQGLEGSEQFITEKRKLSVMSLNTDNFPICLQ